MLCARPVVLAALVAAALPAAAYVLPSSAVLRLAARKRVEVAPGPVELRGTLTSGATAPVGAVLQVKSGRCRLELVGAPDRPYAVVRGGRIAAQRGLDRIPAALALAEGSCALLGPSTPDGLAQSFAARGVHVQEIALGRMGTRVAYVLGGRTPGPATPAIPARPQAWIDKTTLVPLRLVAQLDGAPRDVQLGGHPLPAPPAAGEKPPPPTAADLFPRTLEVSGESGLEARLAVTTVTPDARLAESLF